MQAFVYAIPPAPPAPAVQLRTRMRIVWTGWDGVEWVISDWRSGVFLTQEGTEGLGMPTFTDWAAPGSPFVHGQVFTGYIANPRDLFLPLYLYHDGESEDWRSRDAAFWKSMRPGRRGTLSVETTGGTRTIRARYAGGGEDAYARDPHYFGWARYGVKLVADDPFWYAQPTTKTWEQPEVRDFFNRPGKAAPFNIIASSTLDTARITNPGDMEAWPIWEVRGPVTTVDLGVAGRRVTYRKPIAEGKSLKVDCDPRQQLALLDGEDVTGDLGEYGFAPIPAGADVALSLAMVGTGTVTATINPRYLRAW